MRVARLIVLFALLLAACAAPATPPPAHPPPPPRADAAPPAATGWIDLACEPEDARVVVDGEPRGTVKELSGGLELPRGLHRIEIASEGYRSFRLELNLGEKREKIRVKLIGNTAKP